MSLVDAGTQAVEMFRRVAEALERRDWNAVAALCDPISLRVFHRQLIDQFTPHTGRELTLEDFRRHQPDMPLEVAQYELTQFQKRAAERLSRIDEEVARVTALAELAALTSLEAFSRWLEAHDTSTQLRRIVAQHPEIRRSTKLGVTGLPGDRLEPLGAVVEEPFAHVLYRRAWAASDDTADTHSDEVLSPFTQEEQAWLRQLGRARVQVAIFRHQPDGTWRLPAERSFLNGMTWFGQAHIVGVSKDDPSSPAAA